MASVGFTELLTITALLQQVFFIIDSDARLVLGSINLWNVMFTWEVRIMRIADMVREADIDILVFQEVRMSGLPGGQNSVSQLENFKPLLPDYKWIASYPAGSVARPKNATWAGWEMEGIGVISRKQIVSVKPVNLTVSSSSDKNPRIALQVKIQSGPPNHNLISIWVVHFSYDRHQQCRNARDIISSISSESPSGNVFVLGDFNAYSDFSGPTDMFLTGRSTVCSRGKVRDKLSGAGMFKDAWLASGHQHKDGLTFSNMPYPGLESRPDRILVSKNIHVDNMAIEGSGDDYAYYFYYSIILHRTRAVVAAAYDSLRGRSGYPCLHDCGPHGSCRCGVCVKGGNHLNCDIPTCSECQGKRFVLFISLFVPFCATAAILFYAVLRLLVVSARFTQKDIEVILGYRCCLFNKKLFRISTLPRRYKTLISKIFYICDLPPLLLIVSTVAVLLMLTILLKHSLFDSINTIYSILPEELHPSDHLMVYTSVTL